MVTTRAANGSSAKQVEFQERNGSPGEQRAEYTDGTGAMGPNAPPQGNNPAQQSSNSNSNVPERVPYQGQKLRRREYVDEQGYVMKKKKSRKATLAQHVAAHVAVCLCCAWVCTGPCHWCCCV